MTRRLSKGTDPKRRLGKRRSRDTMISFKRDQRNEEQKVLEVGVSHSSSSRTDQNCQSSPSPALRTTQSQPSSRRGNHREPGSAPAATRAVASGGSMKVALAQGVGHSGLDSGHRHGRLDTQDMMGTRGWTPRRQTHLGGRLCFQHCSPVTCSQKTERRWTLPWTPKRRWSCANPEVLKAGPPPAPSAPLGTETHKLTAP